MSPIVAKASTLLFLVVLLGMIVEFALQPDTRTIERVFIALLAFAFVIVGIAIAREPRT